MTLPDPLRRELEARYGAVRSVRALGGGCINHASRVELEREVLFVKHNAEAPPGFFATEVRGLRRLAEAGSGLRVPEVVALSEEEEGPAWLALEWLEPAARTADFGERLGRGLATLHRDRGEAWGDAEEGFIGSLPQSNAPADGWGEFWAERRLEPQLRRARDAGSLPAGRREWDDLLSRLPALLSPAEEDGPSQLHGDLWSGNVMSVGEGEPALVDPAAYRGHREVDLAMSELFGGFDAGFYGAYRESWPLRPGYEPVRRGVYQLYFLLVHVNLFGGGYVARTEQVLRSVLSA